MGIFPNKAAVIRLVGAVRPYAVAIAVATDPSGPIVNSAGRITGGAPTACRQGTGGPSRSRS